MKLYELSERYALLFDQFDAINDYEPIELNGVYVDDDGEVIPDVEQYKKDMLEAWFDTLEGMEAEITEKAENIACRVKSLQAEQAALKAEINRLTERRKAAEAKAERLKAFLMGVMDKAKLKKIDTTRAVVSISAGRDSVTIDDEAKFIEWAKGNRDDLLKYSEPSICKTEISNALKNGDAVPFVHLEKKPFVSIK